MEEKSKYPGLKFRIIRKGLSITKKEVSFGEVLKISEPQKYASYSAADIDLLVRML